MFSNIHTQMCLSFFLHSSFIITVSWSGPYEIRVEAHPEPQEHWVQGGTWCYQRPGFRKKKSTNPDVSEGNSVWNILGLFCACNIYK